MNNKQVLMMAAFATLSATFTACSDNDDDVSSGGTTVDPSEVSFIVTSNDLSKSLRGGSRMKVFTDLNTPRLDSTQATSIVRDLWTSPKAVLAPVRWEPVLLPTLMANLR